jgi:hypothetical protein
MVKLVSEDSAIARSEASVKHDHYRLFKSRRATGDLIAPPSDRAGIVDGCIQIVFIIIFNVGVFDEEIP